MRTLFCVASVLVTFSSHCVAQTSFSADQCEAATFGEKRMTREEKQTPNSESHRPRGFGGQYGKKPNTSRQAKSGSR